MTVSQPISLTELANKYGSDKGNAVRFRHNYTALYDLIFAPLRLHPIRLLEIGLAVGGPEGGGPIERVANAPSIAMWLEYFPHAEIYGFDISDFSHVRHPRFRFVQGDLGSHGDLARLAATAPQFDIIIDDGSHACYHQQLALSCLFGRLALGGLYVIEGLHWQPASFQAALPAVPKTATLLHDALVRRNDVGSAALPADQLRAIRQWTQSCALFPSFCDDGLPQKLAVLRKLPAPAEQEADARPTVRSFDLFDTLVARRCFEPHAVLREVERRAARPGFAADRIAAEAKLHGAPYTLDDIYRHLVQDTGISDADAGRLRDLELTVEREMLFPIAQHCAEFTAGDVVVSDMYLPAAFLQELVSRICRLPAARLFVSAEGKRNGTIWSIVHGTCTPVEHVGDNPATDLRSARAAGIPARLTTVGSRTAIEADLASAGYEPLGNLIREARLRTWPANEMERHLQRLQIQANFPLLFVATLEFVNISEQNGWRRILFSGRDCFLWTELYQALAPLLGAAPSATYFHSSRLARAHPSPDYLGYIASLCDGEPSVVVDICGTGWSLNRLVEYLPDPAPAIFLVHHLEIPLRGYYEHHAPVTAPIEPLCCLRRGIINNENETLEELNRAPYPLLKDMAAAGTGFQPVFVPEGDAESAAAVLQLHHVTFRGVIALLDTLRAEQVAAMRRADHAAMIARIYRDMEGQGRHVAHFLQQRLREEKFVKQLIEERSASIHKA
jgi:hypothetical protein